MNSSAESCEIDYEVERIDGKRLMNGVVSMIRLIFLNEFVFLYTFLNSTTNWILFVVKI